MHIAAGKCIVPPASTGTREKIRLLLVADLFYKIAHFEQGHARLHPTAQGLGMSAALLAELVISGHLDIHPTTPADRTPPALVVSVHRRVYPPPDLLQHEIFDTLVREREQRTVSEWLRYLAFSAEIKVAERLVRDRVLERSMHGSLRRKTRFEPLDGTSFVGAHAHLATSLMNARQLSDNDWVWAAGLCFATGLHRDMVEPDPASRSQQYLLFLLRLLPPAGQTLMNTTQADIADAVLTHR